MEQRRQLYIATLDTPIVLPTALTVAPWKVKLLKSLSQNQYYALVQIVTHRDMEDMDFARC